MTYTVERHGYQRMIPSTPRFTPDDTPYCTLCSWQGTTRRSTYVATSPSKTTHWLCDIHREAYGHKYTHVIPITAKLLADLTSSDNPLRKGPR